MKNKNYYYVYVLQSETDQKFYTGYTFDLNKRIREHNSGNVHNTKNRIPLKLVYDTLVKEACSMNSD